LLLLARGDLRAVKVPACGIIDTRQSAAFRGRGAPALRLASNGEEYCHEQRS
jgi:hypothetical protein